MKLQFRIRFLQGPRVIAEITGRDNVEAAGLTVQEVTENVIRTEQFLEKLTGLRCHIEQVG